MSGRDELELRRRAIEGIAFEVVALGGGGAESSVLRRDGLVATITPATPERSLFNSVYYEDPAALAAGLDELSAAYSEAGVRAWTVWVPDRDRETAELLAARGHAFDGAPRAMALWLDDLAPAPSAPEGVVEAEGSPADAGWLNDCAYGFSGPGFGTALGATTAEPPLRWSFAASGGELVTCLGTIEVGDDVCVTGVATLPEAQGRGIAAWLLHAALVRGRERGARSGSLRASKAGAGVYTRLGFRDLGYVELRERRTPQPPRKS